MVKHGRNKKRRSGRIGKTSLKNRSYAKFKPPQIVDRVIKANWDPTKSPSVNFQNLGLLNAPNQSINPQCPDRQKALSTNIVGDEVNKPCKAIELYDIPDSDTLKKIKAQGRLPISVENQKYMKECFSKHGNDYKSMSRDRKVNNMQHTENVLRKLGARFLLLNESQRKVDIPAKVRHLMA